MFRSKVKWIEYGEKCFSKWKNETSHNRKVVTEVQEPDRKTVIKEKEIMSEIQTFYEDFYRSGLHDGDADA